MKQGLLGPGMMALSRINRFCLLGITLCLCISGIEAFVVTKTTRNCSDGKWSCHDGKRCIENQYVCDGAIHCSNGSDEKPEVCALWQCSKGMWKCGDNKCIHESKVCNLKPSDSYSNCTNSTSPIAAVYCNCKDGSDEHQSVCSTWNCTSGLWKCKNNWCIPKEKVCDIWYDCGDGNGDRDVPSDENRTKCSTWNCSADYWKCSKYNKCIPRSQVCDGFRQCVAGEDEDPILCKPWNCSAGLWKCDNNMCVDRRHRCDGMKKNACPDDSDESNCEDDCPEGMWKCKDNVTCIDEHYVCDGDDSWNNHYYRFEFKSFCPARSDEDIDVCYNRTCKPGLWKCRDGRICINETLIMDYRPDCLDHSDENAMNFVGRTCSKRRYKTCNRVI